ncbi:MAG TPA: four helix bundle protein [Opitutaceae bacterium]|nr:four helix bundle protein [Opitutaceae bacterium]
MFNFEKLEVWQKSVAYADLVYATTRNFPVDERFGLTAQIRRAACFISSNIAEGAARPPADFSKHLGYAAGSLYETVTQAIIARNQGFLNPVDYQKLYVAAEEISRMLSGLRGSPDK